MATCGSLSAGIARNCSKPITSGTDLDVLLIPKSDWDLAVAAGKITFDATTGNLITDIVLTAGKQGYLFETGLEMVKPKITAELKNGITFYKQELEFPASGLDAVSEKTLDDLKEIPVVSVYKNTFHGIAGETKYKVLGVDSGLRLTKREIDPNGDFAGWIVGLSSRDNALESVGQYSLYKTDEATTDGVYAALQVAAV